MGGAYEWSSFSTVMDYRQKVREMMINVIETAPLTHPITHDHPWVYNCLLINDELFIVAITVEYFHGHGTREVCRPYPYTYGAD